MQENEIESYRRLLGEIAEMCEHASLTGSLVGGAWRTAQRYNSIVKRLEQDGHVPQGLFQAVPEECDFSEIGVEARMLAAYFPKDKSKREVGNGEKGILFRLAPFLGQDELGLLIREHVGKGQTMDLNTLSGLAPFLNQQTLGELVRAHLNEAKVPAETPESKQGSTAQAEPSHPSTPEAPDHKLHAVSVDKEDVEEILSLLKSPYLSDEQRNELVEKLRNAR